MLTIHSSNRLESLADALAGVIRGRTRDPFVPETIIVQSLGMHRWLSFALAERLGVAMNLRFPFPAAFVSELLGKLLPDHQPAPRYERDALPWRILAVLPPLLAREDFAPLRDYASGPQSTARLHQLAGQIAQVFDRYIAYRPDLIREWQRGGKGWQPVLWRALSAGAEEGHAPALSALAAEHLRTGELFSRTLPERFCVFGLSSLAPAYLQFFAEVAAHTEAHLFLLSPTPQFWADLRSAREQARAAKRAKTHDLEHAEEGHPLLASLGRIGREFHDAVADLETAQTAEHFIEPEGRTLLSQLQRDIYDIRDPRADAPVALPAGDRSVQVHNCHSPLRELEVLHDQLLALFDAMPALTPRDILVAVPDIATYAPFIEAVFGSPESDTHRLPFTIADRAAGQESPVAAAFAELLRLAGSRFTSNAVLGLLDYAPIRERAGISEGDLPLLRSWVITAGIRWGADAAHRERLDLPAFAENSWRAGLDRLLLGFALPGDGNTPFEGVLPCDSAEGSAAETLGDFATFVDRLFAACESLAAPRTPGEWAATLRRLLSDFIAGEGGHADGWRNLSQIAGEFADQCTAGEFSEPLAFDIVRTHITSALEGSDRRGGGFLGGGITFCALKPMRAIPRSVVCLLGMNGDAFPRSDRPPGFDLAAETRRKGDRSTRDDDRFLFLEAILSARDVLYISHVGQSTRDAAQSPPSALVSELLETLDAAATLDGIKPSAAIRHIHRLQPFSADYFTGGPLFTYSHEHRAAFEAARRVRAPRQPFAATALPPRDPLPTIPLAALLHFAGNPVRFFCEERLGIRLPRSEDTPDETEPLQLNSLQEFSIRNEALHAHLAGRAGAEDSLLLRGDLPPGYAGRDTLHAVRAEVDQIAARAKDLGFTQPLAPLPVQLEIGGRTIVGQLEGVYAAGLLRARGGKVRAQDTITAWIEHLVLCSFEAGHAAQATTLLGINDTVAFPAVPEPAPLLAEWIAAFDAGTNEPLPLIPDITLKYAQRLLRKADKRSLPPLTWAVQKWEKRDDGWSKLRDLEWIDLALRGRPSPIDESWCAWVARLISPIAEALAGAASEDDE